MTRKITVVVELPEGYEDVCPELCVEDMKIHEAFKIMEIYEGDAGYFDPECIAHVREALPDDFSESKDWKGDTDPVARIEWLKFFHTHYKEEIERLESELASMMTEGGAY